MLNESVIITTAIYYYMGSGIRRWLIRRETFGSDVPQWQSGCCDKDNDVHPLKSQMVVKGITAPSTVLSIFPTKINLHFDLLVNLSKVFQSIRLKKYANLLNSNVSANIGRNC